MKEIYLAGGCFWGTQHYLEQFYGVVETVVGYANGNIENPTYEEVYTDTTGFVESVKVTYDPDLISLSTLCRLFFRSIDPLIKNRQGNDIGTRYRTGIYWSDSEDKSIIDDIFIEIQSRYSEPLAVEKSPLQSFYSAEDYHQEYLIKNPEGYCHISIQTLNFAKTYSLIIRELRSHYEDEKREVLPRFFKCGKGEYGEGDKFIGVSVPNIRKVSKTFAGSSFDLIEALLENEWHECRMCALLILVQQFKHNPAEVVDFYLKHTHGINNWDLVDLSSPYILGSYLIDKDDRSILYRLAESSNMWEQRIAVVATLMLIRNGEFGDTIKLATMFLDTEHNLMQKAVGWMLREVGKRDQSLLIEFLDRYASSMPRTMLRYSIEKFPAEKRMHYMSLR